MRLEDVNNFRVWAKSIISAWVSAVVATSRDPVSTTVYRVVKIFPQMPLNAKLYHAK